MNRQNLCVLSMVATTLLASFGSSCADSAETRTVVAIIGTGDMGDSLGPRFAELGYAVVFGSRYPDGEKAQGVAHLTGSGARVTTQRDAAQAGEIVILAVPWPAMETVAQNLGSLDGKIVIDISMLVMVPLIQRRQAAWEPYFRRSYFWECIWEDDQSEPVVDADDLADVPETQGPVVPCPGTR